MLKKLLPILIGLGIAGYAYYDTSRSSDKSATGNRELEPAKSRSSGSTRERQDPPQRAGAERVALVIGNSAYRHNVPLANPVNDARAVAAALRNAGFVVDLAEDLGLAAMEQKVLDFRRAAQGAKAAWFFYAGHGVEVKGTNYLVPVDADVKEEFQVRHKNFALDQVLGALEDAGSSLKVVVLDCCRDNPFGRGWSRGAIGGLGQVGTTPEGTIIAFAAAPGKTASDGKGTNSPYTEALVKALAQPGLDIDQVFKETGRQVMASTGRVQQPWINSSFYDRFVLVPETANAPSVAAVPAVAPVEMARLDPPAPSIPVLPIPQVEPSPNPAAAVLLNTSRESPYENSLGMQFVPVPITGGPTDTRSSGQRVLFSVWETRVQDYAAFVRESGREWEKPSFQQGADHPAVNVSWEDAVAYCEWLTRMEQASGKLPKGARYRLPTDHEWSCAAGIGEREQATASPMDKELRVAGYPWGSAWPPPRRAGNYDPDVKADSFDETSPVGSFAANPFGLYDLSGNVWEWCEDWYNSERKYRVLRGGAWYNGTRLFLQSSYRGFDAPSNRVAYYGFRCVVVSGG